MTRALRAEWTKLVTTPGAFWLLAATVVLTVGVGAATAAAATYPPFNAVQDLPKTALTGVLVGQAVVAILAVLAVGTEYSTGLIRVTLLAVPRRTQVLVAKAALVGALTAGAGILAAAGSLVAGRILLAHNGFTPAHGYALLSLGDGPTLRAAVGTVAYLVLVGLLTLGVATAVRDTGAGIGAVLGLLLLFPLIAHAISNPHWQRHLNQIGPMTAGLLVQVTTNLRHQVLSPWAGLGVLAAWAAGALALGGLLLAVRDA
ncbi:MAG TPA: ABC transporter permease [Actinomycetota bacterium]|nr:ABC transporter permease [Actinomycetota bacterium]